MDTKRPYIICHMMATIDGKITSGTNVDILEDYYNLYTETEDQLKGDSLMLGRITMEMFAKGENIQLDSNEVSDISNDDFIIEPSDHGYLIAVDSKGSLRFDKNKIKLSNIESELPIVIIVTEQTPKAYLKYLRGLRINYLVAGTKEIDFNLVAAKLFTELKVKKLLLEGGGKINGSILKEDLIDEISLLIIPKVLNRSQAPNVFDRITDDIALKNFKLKSFDKVGEDCIWLRYIK